MSWITGSGLPVVEPPEQLYRVERRRPPLRFSRISASEAADDRIGNRFDIPGAGVLYAATTIEGALAETLASLRPSARLRARMEAAGALPDEVQRVDTVQSWLSNRVIRRTSVRRSLPFVNIEHPSTHAYLTERAADLLRSLHIDRLDVPTVRGHSRLLTRALSNWIYQARDTDGTPLYGGIRYLSKLSNEYECWAIFEGANLSAPSLIELTSKNPALVAVCRRHHIPL